MNWFVAGDKIINLDHVAYVIKGKTSEGAFCVYVILTSTTTNEQGFTTSSLLRLYDDDARHFLTRLSTEMNGKGGRP